MYLDGSGVYLDDLCGSEFILMVHMNLDGACMYIRDSGWFWVRLCG